MSFDLLYIHVNSLKPPLFYCKIFQLAIQNNLQMPKGSTDFRNVWVKYG